MQRASRCFSTGVTMYPKASKVYTLLQLLTDLSSAMYTYPKTKKQYKRSSLLSAGRHTKYTFKQYNSGFSNAAVKVLKIASICQHYKKHTGTKYGWFQTTTGCMQKTFSQTPDEKFWLLGCWHMLHSCIKLIQYKTTETWYQRKYCVPVVIRCDTFDQQHP